ncbi:restriction endonuclease subunit S [Halomonas smyrnensis]|uniref:restriction endonuclease subunit S n=1 Tax=Halomonas smyrnensis TaxID=720605 RepID=UPI0012EAB26F|nr:restriction endonuclease subunit S [Halomonas smyrnensis]
MSFPKYPEVKDSGVEWLGEVPAHWAVERLKLSTESCQNGIWGNDAQGDENDVICIRVADFDRNRMRASLDNPTYRSVTTAEFNSRVVSQGDLLLEKSGGGEKQPVGFVALYEDEAPAICANFIARIRLASGMNPSFWRYVHAAGYTIGLNVPSIKQTSGIQNLDQHSYLNERAAFPPEVEQARIAAFLDHETARIDALVEEQQRLIALLKEKRQAVISHAVTKGLDPDVPKKDSGVEWLGEVPAHWSILPIKRDLAFLTSGSRGWASHYSDEGSAFIRIGNLTRDRIKLDMTDLQRVSVPGGEEGERTKVQEGDVLFSITAYLGSVAVVPSEFETAYVSQHVALARFFKEKLLVHRTLPGNAARIFRKKYAVSRYP